MGINFHYPIKNFRKNEGPLVDLRSPAEFVKGHWPNAKNIPLFSNEERAAIGTAYKKAGQQEAIRIGLEYTGPKLLRLKETLENTCKKYFAENETNNNKTIRLYCWRGGMRSASVAWFSDLIGLKPIILQGGYKSYRRWVLQQFESELSLRLIGGKTGTGKTDLLLTLEKMGIAIIDLEGLANHRGSSFGSLGLPTQPTSEQFENKLAEKIESFKDISPRGIWLEAESANLGKCRIPHLLFKQMCNAPVIEINRPKSERIDQLVSIYGKQAQKGLEEATLRISKRLGPHRTKEAIDAIALKQWDKACNAMLDYYDKCYDHELSTRPHRQTIDVKGLTPRQVAERIINSDLNSLDN